MKKQLYNFIEKLIIEKKELFTRAEEIKYDHACQEELAILYKNYQTIDSTLLEIDESINISPNGVAEILSLKSMQHFILKTFRETALENGKKVYTGGFICCYLSPKNPFYYYDTNPVKNSHSNKFGDETYLEYSIPESEFKELLLSLNDDNCYVLLSNFDLDFQSQIAPTEFIKKVNFISFFTKDKIDGIINPNFSKMIFPVIKQKLENVYVDEKLNVVDFEIEK